MVLIRIEKSTNKNIMATGITNSQHYESILYATLSNQLVTNSYVIGMATKTDIFNVFTKSLDKSKSTFFVLAPIILFLRKHLHTILK